MAAEDRTLRLEGSAGCVVVVKTRSGSDQTGGGVTEVEIERITAMEEIYSMGRIREELNGLKWEQQKLR